MADRNFLKLLTGYSLTTAEITYRLPDHPGLLQTFIWQEYDLHPRFPRLHQFLEFWRENIDGPLHLIRVANARLIHPHEIKIQAGHLQLH